MCNTRSFCVDTGIDDSRVRTYKIYKIYAKVCQRTQFPKPCKHFYTGEAHVAMYIEMHCELLARIFFYKNAFLIRWCVPCTPFGNFKISGYWGINVFSCKMVHKYFDELFPNFWQYYFNDLTNPSCM